MENNYMAGQEYCQEDSLFIVGPDGDDGLVGILTFKLYNYFFQKHDIWVAWGQFLFSSSGNIGSSRSLTPAEIEEREIRKTYGFITNHLKAFYTKIWKMVKKEDLLDKNGKFF